jgi:hypothetical protein
MKLFLNKNTRQITTPIVPKKYAIIFYIVFTSFIGINNSNAQTYLQSRVGYVHQQYKPLSPKILNRNEHDYLGGFMVDFEIGKQLKRKKVTFLYGAKIQLIREYVEGIYTQYKIYRTSFLLTAGLKVPIVRKTALLFQFYYGTKYILWYEEGEFKDSFWGINIPFDISLEFPLNKKWNLVGGTSNTLPIYTFRTHIFYCGIITKL